jgi:hypothetical protein
LEEIAKKAGVGPGLCIATYDARGTRRGGLSV